jgi:hypothetical protein
MKENDNKKSVVRVTEGNPKDNADVLQEGNRIKPINSKSHSYLV